MEKILGRDFLNDAETYGRNMRLACAAQGASETIQASLERMATVAFCKGAEQYRSYQWNELAHRYPRLNTWVLCQGESGRLFVAEFVKTCDGGIKPKDTAHCPTERVRCWMEIPEAPKEGKTVAMKK